MAFLVLSISQLLHALNQRSNTESIFSTGNGHNIYLFVSVFASAVVLILITAIPYFREIFTLARLSGQERLYVALFSVLPLAAVEIQKLFIRHYHRKDR